MDYYYEKIVSREKLKDKYPLLFSPKLYHLKNRTKTPNNFVNNIYFHNKEINEALTKINHKNKLTKQKENDFKMKLIDNGYKKKYVNYQYYNNHKDIYEDYCMNNSKELNRCKSVNSRSNIVIHPKYKIVPLKIYDYNKSKVDNYLKIIQPIGQSKFYNKIDGFSNFLKLKQKYLNN